jgi:hypothetical protein
MFEAVSPQMPVTTGANRQSMPESGSRTERTSAVQADSQKTPADSSAQSRAGRDSVEISDEARVLSELVARDREVRAHEAAHAAAGGAYAGSPSLTYEKGPDGRSYATGGEVPIDTSPVSGDPQATLQKAQVIRSAALAPAQPSGQDMRVASKASAMAARARVELASQQDDEQGEKSGASPTDAMTSVSERTESSSSVTSRLY